MSSTDSTVDKPDKPVSSAFTGTATVAGKSVREQLKARSKQRRELLAKSLGVSGPEQVTAALGNEGIKSTSSKATTESSKSTASSSGLWSDAQTTSKDPAGDGDAAFVVEKVAEDNNTRCNKARRLTKGEGSDDDDVAIDDITKVLKEEEEIYRGSQAFLKGTQSDNPHNDYCQHFVDTGQRPQNFIRDSGIAERFEEYPKLKELIRLKDQLVADTATPPMYWKCDLLHTDLAELGCKFDVIIIEPPLEEYQRTGATLRDAWAWDMIQQLNVPAVADWRCFIWIWCGSGPEGLNCGRQCLKQWGFRRCEDICWIKTNIKDKNQRGYMDHKSLFQRTKEHCLMGIKGTVRRSLDGDFIHANVDIDLIISDDPEPGSIEKPSEIFLVAEHFCLGRRRLHIFGRDDTIRPGWLTIGPELTSTNFDIDRYRSTFEKEPGPTTKCTERIETLRPKSPPPKDTEQSAPQFPSQGIPNWSSGPPQPPQDPSAQPPPPGTEPAMPGGGARMGVGRGRAGWGPTWSSGWGSGPRRRDF